MMEHLLVDRRVIEVFRRVRFWNDTLYSPAGLRTLFPGLKERT